MPGREAEIAEVDAFLAGAKQLQALEGGFPVWGTSHWDRKLGAVWNIENSSGAVAAQLRFHCRRAEPPLPSISLIFQGRPVWRVDLAPSHARHPNPTWASQVGAPAFVDGSNEHSWTDNREFLRRAPEWRELPCVRALPSQIRRLSQMLPWFAGRINLGFSPEQRGFDVPPQAELELYDQ
jgi:hypothetical protein